jgi:hypothetical protein
MLTVLTVLTQKPAFVFGNVVATSFRPRWDYWRFQQMG